MRAPFEIIPTYNEERMIHLDLGTAYEGVLGLDVVKGVVVVNEVSPDGAAQGVERNMVTRPEMRIRCFDLPPNMPRGISTPRMPRAAGGERLIQQNTGRSLGPSGCEPHLLLEEEGVMPNSSR